MFAVAVCSVASNIMSARTGSSDQRKSRYYYYEGLRQDLEGNIDAGYECYRRAVELDPTNLDAKYMMASRSVSSRNPIMTDSASTVEILHSLRQYVDTYPDDLDENVFYGYLVGQRDTTGEDVRVLGRTAERFPRRSEVLIYLSQAYQGRGETANAIEAMNRYEQNEGKSAPLTLHKMSLYLVGGDSIGAMKEVDRLIASDPKEFSYLILKGNLYEILNKRDSAEALYIKAEKMNPEASAPKLALMEVYRDRGDSAAYDNKVYEVLLTEDLEREQKVAFLSQYLQRIIDDDADTGRGDYLFSVLRNQYPHEPDVLNLAARYSAAKEDYDDAAEQIGYAIDMDPKNTQYYQQKMYYLANADRVDDAIKAYEDAEKHVEMTDNMKLYGGLLLQNAGRKEEAMALYRKLVHNVDSTLDIDREIDLGKDIRKDITMEELNFLSITLSSMGDCAFSSNDTTAAFRDYRNALVLNPDNALAANNYAYFSATHGGNLEEALRYSEKSLKGDNANNPTYMDTYAWILYLLDKNDEALEVQTRTLEEMEKAGTPDPEALNHYGDMLKKAGRDEEAVEYWKKALELNPDDAETIQEKIESANCVKDKEEK